MACRVGPPASAPAPAGQGAPAIELVESAPEETTLDRADVANAADVWPRMIDRAQHTIDLAEFYASDAEPALRAESKLAPVIVALERALARGVRVRFLADASFAPKYPETLERLARAGAEVRRFDVGARAGGILHAKYFVVDGVEAFVGSQNFDWRALAHIQEMGVRVVSAPIAGALSDVFETDWLLAAGAPDATRVRAHGPGVDAALYATLVASPRGWLPDEGAWDLPRLVAAIDAARRAIDVQVLLYKTKDRAGDPFRTLDDALRRAAARGVAVRLLVSQWGATDEALAAIGRVPNVAVRVVAIPKWSRGEIPFARVAHAKYMIADGAAWIGTSNWEGDYFFHSRNVGLIVLGGELPARLRAYFEATWTSVYATPLADGAPPSSSGPARP